MIPDFSIISGKYLQDVLSQPAALEETLRDLNAGRELTEFAERLKAGKFDRIVLTGMGSSFHALHPLNLDLVGDGLTAIMVETSELVHYKSRFFSPQTLVIAVKPQDMGVLLDEISPVTGPGKLVISVAAGITTASIGRKLTGAVPVVRVMSNTPVLVDEAMSVISAGQHAGEEHLRRAEELLRPVGKVLRIPESQQDAATALSGSGPAYVYFLVEAMVDAGILLGMPRASALEMVRQAVFGAATMLRDSGEHPVLLREAVTSPGGTTISAIRELERHGVRAAVLAAIEAARDRGRELGAG